MNNSRLSKIEERRNLRRALLLGILSVVLLIILIFFGTPAIVRLAAFLGDIRSSSSSIEKEDTVPPAPPDFSSLPEYTNSDTLKITGRAEPGSTVKIFRDGKEEDSNIADKSGDFVFEVSLKLGQNVFSAISVDQVGNTSQESKKVKIIVDKEEPQLEISAPSEGQSFSGSAERQMIMTGKSEDGGTITVNGRIIVLDSQNNFSYAVSLTEGDNPFVVQATDRAGNKSEKKLNVTYSP